MSLDRDLGECVLTLVQAVFRLAFCDYIGLAYGHDEPGPDKWIRLNAELQADAASFLTSVWGAHLADLAGLTAKAVWTQAQRSLAQRPATAPKPKKAAVCMRLIGTGGEVCRHQEDGELAA